MRCMMKQMVAEQSKDSSKTHCQREWVESVPVQCGELCRVIRRWSECWLDLEPPPGVCSCSPLLHYNYTLCLADWQLLNYKWIPCTWIKTKFSANPSPACSLGDGSRYTRAWNKPSRRFHKTTEEVPTRAFSWMKVPTSAFIFKILLKTLCFAKIGSLMQRT